MPVLEWDKVTERSYQSGIDRGVLYLQDGTSAVWNGLISVEETPELEVKSFYMDGMKYLVTAIPGDFSGKLKAFTYPEIFDKVNGIGSSSPGLFLYDQPPASFNLSYRTMVGEGNYKIHLLYNLIANADAYTFETFGKEVSPIEFSWALTATPQKVGNYRPTAHIAIDIADVPQSVLQSLENILYGTETTRPRFPLISEVAMLLGGYVGLLIVIDNGDGTWTAIDESNTFITMLDETTFQIANANTVFLDEFTYLLTTTDGPFTPGGDTGGIMLSVTSGDAIAGGDTVMYSAGTGDIILIASDGDAIAGGDTVTYVAGNPAMLTASDGNAIAAGGIVSHDIGGLPESPRWDGRPALGSDFVLSGSGTSMRATLANYNTSANQFGTANPDNTVDKRLHCRAPFGGVSGSQVITVSNHNPDYLSVNLGQNGSPSTAAVTPTLIGNHATGGANWENYVGFSVLFPGTNNRGDKAFPLVPGFLQFHEVYSSPWTPSPPWQLGVRNVGGVNKLIMPSQFGPGYPRFWQSADWVTEHWYKIVYHLGMSSEASDDGGLTGGFLELWIDDVQQVFNTSAFWTLAENGKKLITPTAIAGMGTYRAQLYFNLYRSACMFSGEGTYAAPTDGPDDPLRIHFHGPRVGDTYDSVTG